MMKLKDLEFEKMIKNEVVVEEKFENLIWINPIHLVPKANGKMRLVMDMRKVNQFMVHKHFKMEGMPTLKDLIKQNNYAITFDMIDAYNHNYGGKV
jgi:hypothetical protein